jgi:hypothetical protein
MTHSTWRRISALFTCLLALSGCLSPTEPDPEATSTEVVAEATDREALAALFATVDPRVRDALSARGLTLEEGRELLAALETDAERQAWLEENLGDLDLSDLDLPPASELPAPEEVEPVGDQDLVTLPEGAEPAALLCSTATSVSGGFARASSTDPSRINRTSGMIRTSIVASGIEGDQKDIQFIAHDVIAEQTHNRVRAVVNIVEGRNNATVYAPLGGYAASGINLTLEVRSGGRVVCTDRRVLRENRLNGFTAGGELRRETLVLGCDRDRDPFDSTRLEARVVLESWAGAIGPASASAEAEIDIVSISSSGCDQSVAWCSGGTVHTGDFDGDGRADLLCHGPGGTRQVDRAATGGLNDTTDHNHTNSWCEFGELFVGDVNADRRDDLVCKLALTGLALIDWAGTDGSFFGTNTRTTTNFCIPGQWHLGDVDADGDDDLLCHDGSRLTVSLASSGRFSGTSDLSNATVCPRGTMNLHVADVNADRRDDLVCHNPTTGVLSVDLAARAPAVYGTLDGIPNNWCFHGGAQFTMADADGDGRSDAICTNAPSGDLHIDFAATSGRVFDGGAIFRAFDFCGGTNRRLLAGRFDAEGPHEGLLCDESEGRTIRAALF